MKTLPYILLAKYVIVMIKYGSN